MKFVHQYLRPGEKVFYWQEDPSKLQQGRNPGKWLKVDIIVVKGPMVAIIIGSTMFQSNISKVRQPLETVYLEDNSDKRDREGTPVLWLAKQGQVDA